MFVNMCIHFTKTSKVIPLDALDKCPICLEPMYRDIYKFDCQHAFHTKCGLQWLSRNRSCPLCRVPVSEREVLTAVVRYIS